MIDDVAHAVNDLTEVVGRDVGRHTNRNTRRAVDEQVGNTGRQNNRLLALLVEVGHEDDLTEVVGRDVGRHTNRNTRRAVDEQVGNTGRQNNRLLALLVEVGHEVNSFLLDIGEHDVCNLCHTRLGVTVSRRGVAVDGTEVTVTIDERITEGERLRHTYHQHDVCNLCHTRLGVTVSRRGVAVDGTEVTVTIDERITEGERLRHTYHRVIDRRITVRMVVTEHVTDRRCRLTEGLVNG